MNPPTLLLWRTLSLYVLVTLPTTRALLRRAKLRFYRQRRFGRTSSTQIKLRARRNALYALPPTVQDDGINQYCVMATKKVVAKRSSFTSFGNSARHNGAYVRKRLFRRNLAYRTKNSSFKKSFACSNGDSPPQSKAKSAVRCRQPISMQLY